jgi:alkanesulfonate monooxygenase SsuD/methylene tetrahydromethanopterin reductase-like flavin-dependent oxidoreductase (luciferase family)
MMKFGVRTGPQNCSYEDLRRAWRLAEESGFEWVSVWDHFYPALTDPKGACFEAVSIMTALAWETARVRVGCLVFLPRLPQPRGARQRRGDHRPRERREARDRPRLRLEPAGVRRLRNSVPADQRPARSARGERTDHTLAFDDERTTVRGQHFTVYDAYCNPKPVQSRLRLWLGGGERRFLGIVARHADAWNTPFVGPDVYAHKNRVLSWCEKEKRDPGTVLRTVNLDS